MGERVTIRVDANTKEDWTTAVDESADYDTLTHLIQLAVQRELNGMYDPSGGSDTTADGTSVAYNPDVPNQELYEEVRRLHRRLGGVADDITDVKDTVTHDAVPEKRAFFDALPESESQAITPYYIAEMMEFTDTERAKVVLEHLADNTGRVKTTTVGDGDLAYYREV